MAAGAGAMIFRPCQLAERELKLGRVAAEVGA
jgi:hypothetical protein